MRIKTIMLVLAAGTGISLLAPDSLPAQCSGCTSSSTCGNSATRGWCSAGCEGNVCSCADYKCSAAPAPPPELAAKLGESMLVATAGGAKVNVDLVTRCDGRREAFAVVAVPFGLAVMRVRPAPVEDEDAPAVAMAGG